MKRESRENIQKELRELKSSLPGYTGQNGPQVPQGYFDLFPQAVQQKISASENRSKPSWLPGFATGKLIPAAVSLVLVLSVVFSFLLLHKGEEQGFFTRADEALFEDYFAFVLENDRSMIYEMNPEAVFESENIFSQEGMEVDEEQLFEYALDLAEYHGLDAKVLVAWRH